MTLPAVALVRAPVAALALALAFSGCTSKPLRDQFGVPVPIRPDGAERSLEEVRSVIVQACQERGWSPALREGDLIRASIDVRGHSAEIDIPYTSTEFSVLYRASSHLEYNARRQTIHRNYNRWVANLVATIKRRFAASNP